jgi:phage baseplate assembly protein W
MTQTNSLPYYKLFDGPTYTDFDLTMTVNPWNGDVPILTDDVAVKRSIKNLVLTNLYERPMKNEIGSNIRAMLFKPV